MELQNTQADLYPFMDMYTYDMDSEQLTQFVVDMYKATGYYLDLMSFETFYVDDAYSGIDDEIINEDTAKPYGSDEMHTFEGLRKFLRAYKA